MKSGISVVALVAFFVTGILPVTEVSAQTDAVVATPEKTGRVATEMFGRRPFMQQPRLSPDGTKISFQVTLGLADLLKDSVLNPDKGVPLFSMEKPGFKNPSIPMPTMFQFPLIQILKKPKFGGPYSA